MRVSYAILLICAFEAAFFISGSMGTLDDGTAGEPLGQRWSQKIETTPEDISYLHIPETALPPPEDHTVKPAVPPPTVVDTRSKGNIARQLQATSDTSSDRFTRTSEMDEKPQKKSRRGKPDDESQSKASYPQFLYLSLLFGLLLVCHTVFQLLSIRSKRSRPLCAMEMLVLQANALSVVVDVILLAIFGTGVRHLGSCSASARGCIIFGMDGAAAAASFVSLLTLLHYRGGPWLLAAFGFKSLSSNGTQSEPAQQRAEISKGDSSSPNPVNPVTPVQSSSNSEPTQGKGDEKDSNSEKDPNNNAENKTEPYEKKPQQQTPEVTAAKASTLSLLSLLVWPGILSFPLFMTTKDNYRWVFPHHWYAPELYQVGWPSPLGLSLGLLAVAVGQVFTLIYHSLRVKGYLGALCPIQRKPAPVYSLPKEILGHLSQPEGFVMLGLYLSGTWMFNLMPSSYYSFEGGIQWELVALQLLLQDGVQYGMHMLEHRASAAVYKVSHKPHHRFTNPKLFDAFNGSPADTFLMILVPLFITANIVRTANVWSYMAFGSLYANWLTLIHSEHAHIWDRCFRKLGWGTAADHHIHHALFIKNYGHLFMYYDWVCGTYKDPATCDKFNPGV